MRWMLLLPCNCVFFFFWISEIITMLRAKERNEIGIGMVIPAVYIQSNVFPIV